MIDVDAVRYAPKQNTKNAADIVVCTDSAAEDYIVTIVTGKRLEWEGVEVIHFHFTFIYLLFSFS